jgi:tetratricopeptide (TPR) repeat protein
MEQEEQSYTILFNKIMKKPSILEQHPCFLEFMRNYLHEKDEIIENEDLPPNFEVESPKTQGKKAMISGDFPNAIYYFTECLKQEQWNCSPLMRSQRAEAYYENGNIEKAMIDANDALSNNPNSAKALVVKAKCHNTNKEFKEAFESISKAQSIDYNPELNEFVYDMKVKITSKNNTSQSQSSNTAPSSSNSSNSSQSLPNMMNMLKDPNMIALAQNMLQQNPEMIQNYMKSLEGDSCVQDVLRMMQSPK